jgi:hypothetical protein
VNAVALTLVTVGAEVAAMTSVAACVPTHPRVSVT